MSRDSITATLESLRINQNMYAEPVQCKQPRYYNSHN